MSKKSLKILDLGCKNEKMPDAIGVDIDKNSDADIIHDLNVYPYPFKENTIDQVYAKHIIEHLDDPRGFLKEIWRILKPQATVFIETPHFSNYVAYAEPQHKLYYSYFMFKELLKGIDLQVVKQEITFYKTFRLVGIKFLANKFPLSYERFWTYLFPAENIKVLLRKK